MFDSRPDTYEHIGLVRGFLTRIAGELLHRGHVHDASKLVDPEKAAFDRTTPLLAGLTYGSEEYRHTLHSMKDEIEHHYSVNRHHPEFHENGISDMNLLDLIEMLSDWKAASMRHDDGDMARSIKINARRFGYGEEIERLLTNTAAGMGWLK